MSYVKDGGLIPKGIWGSLFVTFSFESFPREVSLVIVMSLMKLMEKFWPKSCTHVETFCSRISGMEATNFSPICCALPLQPKVCIKRKLFKKYNVAGK